jgi:hypothetical protein
VPPTCRGHPRARDRAGLPAESDRDSHAAVSPGTARPGPLGLPIKVPPRPPLNPSKPPPPLPQTLACATANRARSSEPPSRIHTYIADQEVCRGVRKLAGSLSLSLFLCLARNRWPEQARRRASLPPPLHSS